MKEHLKKFGNSLALSMGSVMMYVPCLCIFNAMKKSGWGLVSYVMVMIVLALLLSYVLFLLIGDVSYKEVDTDRRIKGIASLAVLGLVLYVIEYFVVDSFPEFDWMAIGTVILILFVAGYSICKQYIMKNE